MNQKQSKLVLAQYVDAGGVIPVNLINKQVPLFLKALYDVVDAMKKDEEIDRAALASLTNTIILNKTQAYTKEEDTAIANGYTVIGISASSTAETEKLAADYQLDFLFYFCDMTTLKTIIRSNPSIMSLERGTILQKLHFQN